MATLAAVVLPPKLLARFKDIVDNLTQVDSVVDHLVTNKVFAPDDSERIQTLPTSSEKARKLLHILMKKPNDDIEHFMCALKKTEQTHIWDQIMDTEADLTSLIPSATVTAPEILTQFIEGCVTCCLTLNDNCTLKLEEITAYFKHLNNKNRWTHIVSDTDVVEAIQRTFTSVSTISSSSDISPSTFLFKGLTWKAGSGEINRTTSGPIAKSEALHREETTTVKETSMDTWSVSDVSRWLLSQDLNDDFVNAFKDEEIDGPALKLVTLDQIKAYIVKAAKMGPLIKLLKARDDMLLGREQCSQPGTYFRQQSTEVLKSNSADPSSSNHDSGYQIVQEAKVITPCRIFGSLVSQNDMYPESTYFQPASQTIGDPLQCIQCYVSPDEPCITNKENMNWLQKNIIEFTCACANDRTNGTLYVGVGKDGKLVGITGQEIEQKITCAIKEAVTKFCYDDEAGRISKCIQTLKCIPILGNNVTGEQQQKYVLEIDISPDYTSCQKDVFWVRSAPTNRSLFRFKEGIPVAQSDDEIKRFMSEKNRMALHRKQMELQKNQLKYLQKPDQDKIEKLKMLLCRGGQDFGDTIPILVTNTLPELNSDEMREQFHFLKEFDWQFVFDFDSTGKLYSFLDEQEQQVLTVMPVDELDPQNNSNADALDKLHTVFLNQTKKWLFANGCNTLGKSPSSVNEWKKGRGKAFREAVRLIKGGIPNGRLMIIFMVFSPELELMYEAADELITEFQDSWITIAEDDNVMEEWFTGLCLRHLVKDRTELIPRSITNTSWSEVNKVICGLVTKIELGAIEIPSSDDSHVVMSEKLINSLTDLELLSSTHCSHAKINKEERERLFVESQQTYYRGGQADWWNFHYGHVIPRHCVSNIVDDVKEKMFEPVEDDRVVIVDLLHQPGAGGSTVAKHVLWKLKEKCRCVVVRNITDQTADQIQTVHNYLDTAPQPVLLLLDNKDYEATINLKADLEEKNRHAKDWELDAERHVFYVFLCTRRASAPDKQSHFYLKQELTPGELERFKNRFREVTERFKDTSNERLNPKHMISFNIMKENFDEAYIDKTVSNLISEICDHKELELLKYIAMINSYDINFQPVPVSAFDTLMDNKRLCNGGLLVKPKWEEYLSMPLTTLLTREYGTGQSSGRHIRIIHGKVSEKILNQLLKKFECTLADMFDEFLSLPLFTSHFRNIPVKHLLAIVADVVKKRNRDQQTNKPDTKFSPLIQAIIKDPCQGNLHAIDILDRVYNLSGDVFVGQQLARMYMHCDNWGKAREIAQRVAFARPSNSYLWDTYGLTCLRPLQRKFNDVAALSNVKASDILETLQLAMNAISIFQQMQRASEAEKTLQKNTAGYIHELDTICQVLQCLSRVEGLAEHLRDVLTGMTQFPADIRHNFGENLVTDILKLQLRADFTMAQLEEQTQYNKKVEGAAMVYDLNKYREKIGSYFKNERDIRGLPEQHACSIRRGKVNILLGKTYWAVFKLRKDSKGLSKLKDAEALLQENLKVPTPDMSDVNKFLNVKLTLCCMDGNIRKLCSHGSLAEYSKMLYKNRCTLHFKNFEPYLHAAMLNWPMKQNHTQQSMMASEIVALLQNWSRAYNDKLPLLAAGRFPRPEMQLVYLGPGVGMERYVFFENLKIPRDIPVNESRECVSKLQWFVGSLLDRGSKVRFEVSERGNITRMEIATYRQVRKRTLFNHKVFFSIVFTWAGPKAIGVCLEDPSITQIKS